MEQQWFNNCSTIVQRLFNDGWTVVQKLMFPRGCKDLLLCFQATPTGSNPIRVVVCYKQVMPMASGSGINNENNSSRWFNGGSTIV